MSKRSGVIFDLGNSRYGIAYYDEQRKEFWNYGKVYLHIFIDVECTVPEKDPKTGKNYVTLKDKSKIKGIGFVD